MSKETIKCPNCNDAMHNSYVRIEKSDGKKTWRVIPNEKHCPRCNIKKPSPDTKLLIFDDLDVMG